MNIYVEDPQAEYQRHKDFTSLRCWQNCRVLKLFFYKKILPKLPAREKDNLDYQIRKSTRSSTANIAEGVGRYHYQELIQFLRISRGSVFELKDDLISSLDLEYIDEATYSEGIILIEEAKMNLNGFINYIERKKKESKK